MSEVEEYKQNSCFNPPYCIGYVGNTVLFPLVHIEKYKSLRDVSNALQAYMANKYFLTS